MIRINGYWIFYLFPVSKLILAALALFPCFDDWGDGKYYYYIVSKLRTVLRVLTYYSVFDGAVCSRCFEGSENYYYCRSTLVEA